MADDRNKLSFVDVEVDTVQDFHVGCITEAKIFNVNDRLGELSISFEFLPFMKQLFSRRNLWKEFLEAIDGLIKISGLSQVLFFLFIQPRTELVDLRGNNANFSEFPGMAKHFIGSVVVDDMPLVHDDDAIDEVNDLFELVFDDENSFFLVFRQFLH